MSNPEPPPPSWQGGQPPDPSAPPPPGSGPPDPYTPPPPPPGYGQPADPYAPPPSYGQPDPYAPQGPTGPMPGYGAPPPPGQPYPGQQPFPGQPYGPPPTQKSKGGKIALIVGGIVLVLLCGCVGAVVYGVNRAKDAVEEAVKTPPAPAPTGSQSPGSTGDSDSYEKGDCVLNDGTDSAPELRKVECAAGTLEVLAVIPFSTDKEQCDNEFLGAGGKHDSTYTYDETPGSLGDYVLCLKRRS